MNNHLGRVSPSHFLQNVLIKDSDVCFKKLLNFLACTLPFLNLTRFGRFKSLEDPGKLKL